MKPPMPPLQLSEEEYEGFRELVQRRTGLLFEGSRRDALARGVEIASRRAGQKDLGTYLRFLQQAPTDGAVWEELIDALTVGETYFFRDAAQFEALRQHVLPELIARHQDDRCLRLWSAGCATGEEPYSLAILLRELGPDLADWNVSILATDLNRQALRQAGQGRYREWSFRQTDPALRARYFSPWHGSSDASLSRVQDPLFELQPQVREMVTWAYLNLAEDPYPSRTTHTQALDLILCRNVAIYLPEAVIKETAERFYRCLAPGGWLIVSAAEANVAVYDQFTVRNFPGATVYQKTRGGGDPETRRPEDMERGRPGDPKTWRGGDPEKSCSPLVSGSPDPSVSGSPSPLVPLSPYPLVSGSPGLPVSEAWAAYQQARELANHGQLAAARGWCQRALEQDPLLVEAHYTLALIYQEEGVLELAIDQLRKTLYLAPDFVLAHLSLAHLYQQAGRRNEADRHHAQTLHLAAQQPPDEVLPGSDGLTAGRLLTMVQGSL